MRFLGDMGISILTIKWLREIENDAIHLTEERLHRLPDRLIFRKAQEEKKILLTCDLDFSHLLYLSKSESPTTIIFRFEFQTPFEHIKSLKELFTNYHYALESKSIISIDDKKIRIRALPII